MQSGCWNIRQGETSLPVTWLQQMLETTAISKLSSNHEESNALHVDFRARNALVSVIGQLNYHYSTRVFSINDQVFYTINIVEREYG